MITVFILMSATPAQAADSRDDPMLLRLIGCDPYSDQWTREQQSLLATAIRGLFEPLYLAVPEPTPEQEAWLQREEQRVEKLKTAAQARTDLRMPLEDETYRHALVELAESRPARLTRARTRVSEITASLRAIENPEVSTKVVVALWVDLLQKLFNGPLSAHHSLAKEEAITVPSSILTMDYGDNWSFGPDSIAKNLLSCIVAPHVIAEAGIKVVPPSE